MELDKIWFPAHLQADLRRTRGPVAVGVGLGVGVCEPL
jgi:hypothetical protein